MSETLYNQALKSLAALPARRLEAPTASAVLDNPLCGDRVTVDIALVDGRIATIGHEVKGCLPCRAAAAAMARLAEGRRPAEVGELAVKAAAMLAGAPPPDPLMEAFLPARPHRNRHACVLLPFEALTRALA